MDRAPVVYTCFATAQFSTSGRAQPEPLCSSLLNRPMSYLAYPPRQPVEFSESVAQLITLTLKIKHEVAPHKNEHKESLTRWGRASIHRNKPMDARSALLRRQVRKSRYWIAFAGESDWGGYAELSSQERLDLSTDLLRNLEGMYLLLQAGGICPLTKVTTLNRALAMRPVLSIRQLAEDALISESTAKRWLKALVSRGVLSSVLKDGQRQYINDGLVRIIGKYV